LQGLVGAVVDIDRIITSQPSQNGLPLENSENSLQ
jgi:hypothetical protein